MVKRIGIFGQIVVYCFFSLAIFVASGFGWLKPLQRAAEQPVIALKQQLTLIYRSVSFVNSLKADDREIARLSEEVARFNSIAGEIVVLREENRALKEQLAIKTAIQEELVEASPIGITGGMMSIDAGSDRGVTVGNSVIFGRNLVGRVVLVTVKQARVLLPVYEGEKIPTVTRKVADGVKKASGLVIGQSSQLILDRVVQAEDLEKGDLVMTVGGNYERDLVIGQVAEVLNFENQLFKKARIEPGVDYGRLDRVFVIIK